MSGEIREASTTCDTNETVAWREKKKKKRIVPRMESWSGLIAKVKHRMQLSPMSAFMPFCSADSARKTDQERRVYNIINRREAFLIKLAWINMTSPRVLSLRDEKNISPLNLRDFSKIFGEKCHLISLQFYILQWLNKLRFLFQLYITNW